MFFLLKNEIIIVFHEFDERKMPEMWEIDEEESLKNNSRALQQLQLSPRELSDKI